MKKKGKPISVRLPLAVDDAVRGDAVKGGVRLTDVVAGAVVEKYCGIVPGGTGRPITFQAGSTPDSATNKRKARLVCSE